MSLRTKTLIIVFATLIGLMAVAYLTAVSVLSRGYNDIEQMTMQQNVGRVVGALSAEQANLNGITQDYASWDDTYTFIEDKNPEYIKKNIIPETLNNLSLDLMVFIDISGKVVYSIENGINPENEVELPESLKQHFLPGSPLLNPLEPDSTSPNLLSLPGGPLLVASKPILTSSGEGPARGTLVFGRFLDQAEIERLSDQTQLQISSAGWENVKAGNQPEFQAALEAFQQGQDPVFIKTINSQSIAGYTYLRDIDGEPALLIKVDAPRDIYWQSQVSIRSLLIGLGASGLAFILIILLLLEKLILAPLIEMSTAISAIGSTGEFDERLPVSGRDELANLAVSINRMLLETLEQRSNDLDKRLLQIRTAADVAQIATSGGPGQAASAAHSLKELLNQTIHLIIERFDYAYASIYLLDNGREYAILADTTSEGNNRFKVNTFRLPVGSRSMVGWVTANNRPRVASEVSQDPYYLKDEFLPDVRSEAVVPIAIGEIVLGALDVQSHKPNAFQTSDLIILQTLSNQLATAIHNIRLLEATQFNLEEASLLYQASRNITQASSADEILRVVDSALHETSYLSSVYSVYAAGLRKVLQATPLGSGIEPFTERLPVTAQELESLLPPGSPYLIIDFPNTSTLPYPLLHLLRQWQCETAAVLPVMCNNQLTALFVLGSKQKGALNPVSLQPYASLVEVTATAIQKVEAIQATDKSLAELRTLNEVSQAVSIQTELSALYQVVHHAVIQLMGEVDFLVALYAPENDMIQIPYMWEKDRLLTISPIPLGEGLISVLLRTRQPLMLIEDTEKQAAALGAVVVGKPAKSWLGVPMIVGGDVTGAIVVQDVEHEHRFTVEDQRLLTTLSAQVAAAIRNAHILERTRLQARRERLLHEVTSKIRGSVDMHTILETATTELGKALNVRRAQIKLGVEKASVPPETLSAYPSAQPSNGQDEEGES